MDADQGTDHAGKRRRFAGQQGGSPAKAKSVAHFFKVPAQSGDASTVEAMNSELSRNMMRKLQRILEHEGFVDLATMDPPPITAEEAEMSGMQVYHVSV